MVQHGLFQRNDVSILWNSHTNTQGKLPRVYTPAPAVASIKNRLGKINIFLNMASKSDIQYGDNAILKKKLWKDPGS